MAGKGTSLPIQLPSQVALVHDVHPPRLLVRDRRRGLVSRGLLLRVILRQFQGHVSLLHQEGQSLLLLSQPRLVPLQRPIIPQSHFPKKSAYTLGNAGREKYANFNSIENWLLFFNDFINCFLCFDDNSRRNFRT